jgi:hypothetical protein
MIHHSNSNATTISTHVYQCTAGVFTCQRKQVCAYSRGQPTQYNSYANVKPTTDTMQVQRGTKAVHATHYTTLQCDAMFVVTYQSVNLHLVSVDELLASESKVVCSNIERSRNLDNLFVSLCLVSVCVHSLVLIYHLLAYCIRAYRVSPYILHIQC